MSEQLSASAGGVSVAVGAEAAASTTAALAPLVADDVAAKLAAGDASLWGPDAATEAAKRLGWLRLATTSRALIPALTELSAALRKDNIDRVVLAGMGGSSLAPEVICATSGAPLVTLDTTDPGQVASALVELERTVVVVSSKSGGTLETDSHHRAFRAAFAAAGLDPAQHIVIVTDPESPLEAKATDLGVRAIFRADPNVGGRYSALTAFGLVPSALAGVDIEALLDQAQAAADSLADSDGPGLLLGAALGSGAASGRDKLVLLEAGSGIPGFGDWAEQLVAESTGKQGRGLLPVVVDGPDAPGIDGPDRQLSLLGADSAPPFGTAVSGPLGALFLIWEFATAVAGRVLEIDPFDQPNVQESKDNTSALLKESGDGPLPEGTPAFSDGAVDVYGGPWLGSATTLQGALEALLAAAPAHGYVAVMAYLDRLHETAAAGLRDGLAAATPAAVTFGWAPRFLHSTGQYHKGGPAVGVFLQITAEPELELVIPDQPFDFGRLQRAQSLGDGKALAQRGRPVLRVHLRDRAAGLAALLAATHKLGG
jgi:hypothetical protein